MKTPPTGEPTPPQKVDPVWKAIAIAAALHAALLALTPLFPQRAEPPSPLTDATQGLTFDIETVPTPARPADPASSPSPEEAPAAEPPGASPEPPAGDSSRAKIASVPKAGAVVDPERPAPPAEPAPASPESPPPPAAVAPAAPVAPSSPEVAANPESPAPAAPAPPATPPATPPGDGFSPLEPASPIPGIPGIPGIGGSDGRPVWALPGVLAPGPTAPPAAARPPEERPVDRNIAGQVLSGTLQKKDQEIGLSLPAGGIVASEIAAAVRSSEAPPDARATFEVRLGADGKVTGIRVVSSTAGSAASWERVASRAASGMASRALAMSGDAAAKGATVTVKIESKVVYPAGTKEKVDIQPVCVDEVIEEALNGIGDAVGGEPSRGPLKNPAMNRPDPAKEKAGSADAAEEKRRFCIPIGIKGKGDLSNIGAHTQKVVRSSFQVSIPGSKPLIDVKKVDTRAPWSPEDPNKVKPLRPKRPKKKKKP